MMSFTLLAQQPESAQKLNEQQLINQQQREKTLEQQLAPPAADVRLSD